MMMDITFAGAAFAGLLSFLSPCILPIVPFYLSYLAGAGMDKIASGAGLALGTRRRAVLAWTTTSVRSARMRSWLTESEIPSKPRCTAMNK